MSNEEVNHTLWAMPRGVETAGDVGHATPVVPAVGHTAPVPITTGARAMGVTAFEAEAAAVVAMGAMIAHWPQSPLCSLQVSESLSTPESSSMSSPTQP